MRRILYVRMSVFVRECLCFRYRCNNFNTNNNTTSRLHHQIHNAFRTRVVGTYADKLRTRSHIHAITHKYSNITRGDIS